MSDSVSESVGGAGESLNILGSALLQKLNHV